MNKKNIVVDSITVFVLSIVSRIIFTVLIASNNPNYFYSADTKTYHDLSCNLLKYGTFIIDKADNPGIFRTPGYPLFLAFVYSIFGINSLPVIIFQIILSSIGCVLLYYMLSRMFDRWVALTGAFLYLLDMPSIYYSNKILSETLFTCIFIAFIFAFTLFFEKQKYIYIVVSGLLLGIVTLIRPVTYYLVIFLFVAYFAKQIKKGIGHFIIFTLMYMCVVMPWVFRNYTVAGYCGISAAKELNLCNFKGAWIEMARRQEHDIYKIQEELIAEVGKRLRENNMEDNALNRTLIRGAIGKKILFSNIPLFINYQIRFTADVLFSTGMDLMAEVFLNTSAENFENQSWFVSADVKYLIYLIILYLFVIIGVIATLKKQKIQQFSPLLLILLYMVAIHGEFDGRSRFRVPIMPLIIIFFCLGLSEISQKIKLSKLDV